MASDVVKSEMLYKKRFYRRIGLLAIPDRNHGALKLDHST